MWITAAVGDYWGDLLLDCFIVLLGDDISRPLKHSFIHTGHADATGKLWGDPGQIDE